MYYGFENIESNVKKRRSKILIEEEKDVNMMA
jgi:hypothetical protein